MSTLTPKYVVSRTNADLEVLENLIVHISRDYAESFCLREFRKSGCLSDFLVWHQSDNEPFIFALSARTLQLRGECMG